MKLIIYTRIYAQLQNISLLIHYIYINKIPMQLNTVFIIVYVKYIYIYINTCVPIQY